MSPNVEIQVRPVASNRGKVYDFFKTTIPVLKED